MSCSAALHMRYACLALFSIGMMLALHPFPREPWGVLGLGDLFTGYVLALASGLTYAALALRRRAPQRRTTITAIESRREVRRAA